MKFSCYKQDLTDALKLVIRAAAEHSIELPAKTFAGLVRRTVFAVGNDESRPIFTGVQFKMQNNILSLIATNTHRLAFTKKMFDKDYPDFEFVVPAETLKGILAQIDTKSAEKIISIDYTTRNLTFAFENFIVSSRLLEGVFPPTDKLLNEETSTRACVDTAEFKDAVYFVALMAKETEYGSVKLAFANNAVEIFANSNNVGDAVKKIDAQVDGGELTIAFNASYLTDVLKVIDTPKIFIDLEETYAPIKITEPDNENFIYIVTPTRA